MNQPVAGGAPGGAILFVSVISFIMGIVTSFIFLCYILTLRFSCKSEEHLPKILKEQTVPPDTQSRREIIGLTTEGTDKMSSTSFLLVESASTPQELEKQFKRASANLKSKGNEVKLFMSELTKLSRTYSSLAKEMMKTSLSTGQHINTESNCPVSDLWRLLSTRLDETSCKLSELSNTYTLRHIQELSTLLHATNSLHEAVTCKCRRLSLEATTYHLKHERALRSRDAARDMLKSALDRACCDSETYVKKLHECEGILADVKHGLAVHEADVFDNLTLSVQQCLAQDKYVTSLLQSMVQNLQHPELFNRLDTQNPQPQSKIPITHDWFNSLIERVYKDATRSKHFRDKIEKDILLAINRRGEKPGYIDEFTISSISFDDKVAPTLKNVLLVSSPTVETSDYDVNCSGDFSWQAVNHFSLRTNVLVNLPIDREFAIPVYIKASVVKISGHAQFGVTKHGGYFSFVSEPVATFEVESQIGREYALKNVSALGDIIVHKIKEMIRKKLVLPNRHQFPLPWPQQWWPESETGPPLSTLHMPCKEGLCSKSNTVNYSIGTRC